MTLLRRILWEPDLSGQSILSGHLEGSRGCLLNTGLTVLFLQSTGEKLLKYQENSPRVIISLILMTSGVE